MSAPHPSHAASYFNGQDAAAHAVVLHTDNGAIVARGDTLGRQHWPRAAFAFDTPAGAPRQVLRTPDGATLVLAREDVAALGIAPVAVGLAERLAGSLAATMVAALGLIAVMVLAYVDLLPRVATLASVHLPLRIEAHLGAEMLHELDRQTLATARASAEQRAAVKARFEPLARAAGLPHARVIFRAGRLAGANAFALPGGTIVVTDEILALMGPSPRLDAVLAHELAHQAHHDGARLALQRAGVGAMLSLVMKEQPGASTHIAAVAPRWLLESSYSRAIEAEADRFAFALLRATGRSPADFADAMELLQSQRKDDRARYLNSHPQTPDRIEAARRAP